MLIEEQRELADFCVNLAKEYQGISFSKMSSEKIPDYMHKTDEKSVFIVLDSIKALDEYAAVEMAKSIIKTFDHFYLLFVFLDFYRNSHHLFYNFFLHNLL